jgi:hypothetical protein
LARSRLHVLTRQSVAAAHSGVRHRDHRHIAARQRTQSGVGAQEKKRGNARVIRRADGSQCRVRGSSPSLSPVSSASAATSIASSAASSTTDAAYSAPAASSDAASAASFSVEVVSSSSAVPGDDSANLWAGENWGPPSASFAAGPSTTPNAPASTTSPAVLPVPTQPNTGGGTGGWLNTGSKLGSAWPNGNWAGVGQSDYIGNYVGSKTSWYYTWSPWPVVSGGSS